MKLGLWLILDMWGFLYLDDILDEYEQPSKTNKKKTRRRWGSKSLCPSCKWPEWLSTLMNLGHRCARWCLSPRGRQPQRTCHWLYPLLVWRKDTIPALASWAIASKLKDLLTIHSEGVCCFTQSKNLPSPAPSFSRKTDQAFWLSENSLDAY